MQDGEQGFSPLPPGAFLVPAHDVAAVDALHGLVQARFAAVQPGPGQGSVGGTALASVCDALKVRWLARGDR